MNDGLKFPIYLIIIAICIIFLIAMPILHGKFPLLSIAMSIYVEFIMICRDTVLVSVFLKVVKKRKTHYFTLIALLE